METTRAHFLEHVELIKSTQHDSSGIYAIADFILLNKDNYDIWNQKLTIFEVGVLTHTSSSSITRFAQKLGLTGFRELLAILRKKEGDEVVDPTSLSKYKDDFLFKCQIVIAEIYENIKLLLKINKDLQIKKRIFFFGVQENSCLMKTIVSVLETSKVKVYFSNNEKQQELYTSMISKQDVVVLIAVNTNEPFFKNLLKVINQWDLLTVILAKNWEGKMLENLKTKNVLKLGILKDDLFNDTTNELSTIFYLKVLFASLLDFRILR